MTYDRFEGRRGWREQRSRFAGDPGDRYENRGFGRSFDRDDDDRDRGFFERAGDEVASWFGDEGAERRRREDARRLGDDDSWRRRSLMSDDDYSRYDRQPRFRDEGYRRPYTGRFFGRRGFGDEDRYDRGYPPERGWSTDRGDYTGMAAGGLHDPHYGEWRRRQISELDRDYDEYRRENQSRFESDFSAWRATRQGKRSLLGQVREHMNVVGSDEEHLGTIDCVRDDQIVLTKSDSDDNRHHMLSCTLIDRIEGDRVVLDRPAVEAKSQIRAEGRERGFFRDEERETGPHMLNRSFSGTYER